MFGGNGGNDTITGRADKDTIDGGSDFDIATYSRKSDTYKFYNLGSDNYGVANSIDELIVNLF